MVWFQKCCSLDQVTLTDGCLADSVKPLVPVQSRLAATPLTQRFELRRAGRPPRLKAPLDCPSMLLSPMDSEIKQYEQQLEQVVQGLKADPDNVDLAALRDELANLISLTRSLASEQAGSSSSAGQPSQPKAAAKTTSAPPVHPATTSKVAGGTNQPSQAVQLSAGSECLAKYAVSTGL